MLDSLFCFVLPFVVSVIAAYMIIDSFDQCHEYFAESDKIEE